MIEHIKNYRVFLVVIFGLYMAGELVVEGLKVYERTHTQQCQAKTP